MIADFKISNILIFNVFIFLVTIMSVNVRIEEFRICNNLVFCASFVLSVSSSSWCLVRAAVCDCGTLLPWFCFINKGDIRFFVLAWDWLAKPTAKVVIPKFQPLSKHVRKNPCVKVKSTASH